MTTFKINDVELELDMADADIAEKAESAINTVQKASQEKLQKVKSYTETIRATCGLVNGCFDTIFGSGTAEKLFHGKQNMLAAIDAFAALSGEIQRQTAEIGKHTQDLAAKYSPNRAERRHLDKK